MFQDQEYPALYSYKRDYYEFLEFAIENFSEMMEYIVQGNLNIGTHRDITGEVGFWVDKL
jgi:hypothetical protein